MNLQNYYWYFESALPHRICDQIIEVGNSLREELALTGDETEKALKGQSLSNNEINDLKKRRDSNVSWLSDNWIYKEIQPYINTANTNANWNFQWDYSEACQFTKYGKGQFYDWHCDSFNLPYNDPTQKHYFNKIRKLSVTVSLNDGFEYEGGDLEFRLNSTRPDKKDTIICEDARKKGSIIVFPSFVWHRVKPVTKGNRYSLVIWSLGWPFR